MDEPMPPVRRGGRITMARLGILCTIVGLCIGAAVLFLRASAQEAGSLGFPLDDSWIHLQFARNVAERGEFSFNPGQPTPGSTAPLWTLVLGCAGALAGHLETWAYALGVLFYVASCLLLVGLSLVVDPSWRKAGACGLLGAVGATFVWASVSGLEIPLFTFLSLLGILAHMRRWGPWEGGLSAGVLFGLGALTRPEGVGLFALSLVDEVFRLCPQEDGSRVKVRIRVGPLLARIISFCLAIAPQIFFCLWCTGRPLPNTFYAKAIGERDLLSAHYLVLLIRLLGRDFPVLALFWPLGIVAVLYGQMRREGQSPSFLVVAWPFALALGYNFLAKNQFTVGAGNFGRYFYPALPLLGLLCVHGVFFACEIVRVDRLRVGSKLLIDVPLVLSIVFGALAVQHTIDWTQVYALNVRNVNDMDVRVARWIAKNVPRDAVVATNDIGAIGYLSRRNVLDTVGIATPEIIPFLVKYGQPNETFRESGVMRFLSERRPDYVAIFPEWYPNLSKSLSECGILRPVFDNRIKNNITCGADRMVVFRAQWPANSSP